MKTIILIYGTSGSGKTTLAKHIVDKLHGNVLWLNGDKVRATLSSDLGFSHDDRIEQARRIASVAQLYLDGSECSACIVDFINPTAETNEMFMNSVTSRVFSILMGTVTKCEFEDTNSLFNPVRTPNFIVDKYLSNDEFEDKASELLDMIFKEHNEI